jgi:hypothetical protein
MIEHHWATLGQEEHLSGFLLRLGVGGFGRGHAIGVKYDKLVFAIDGLACGFPPHKCHGLQVKGRLWVLLPCSFQDSFSIN